MRVELPDNKWAELADPGELRNADRKAVNRAIRFEMDPETKQPIIVASMDDDMREAMLRRVIKNWNLDLPLPSMDPESLDKLTIQQAECLLDAIDPHMDLVNGKINPRKKGTDPTAGSST